MYNCLIILKKKVMLLSKMFLQLQMRAPRYSKKLFTVNKVTFIVNGIFTFFFLSRISSFNLEQ